MSFYENITETETFSHCENSTPIHSARLSYRENHKAKREMQSFTPFTNTSRTNSTEKYSPGNPNKEIINKPKQKPFSSKFIRNNDEYFLCLSLSDISDLDLNI